MTWLYSEGQGHTTIPHELLEQSRWNLLITWLYFGGHTLVQVFGGKGNHVDAGVTKSIFKFVIFFQTWCEEQRASWLC